MNANNFNLNADMKKLVAQAISHQKLTEEFIKKVVKGVHDNAILQGPPGLGKSHVVMHALKNAGLVEKRDFVIIKGHITSLNLFALLYLYKEPGKIIVLDDCDTIFSSENGLNFLKAAMDPNNRTICYHSSRIPLINSVPVKDFVFNGKIIICTNIDMLSDRESRRNQHVRAIQSRSTTWPFKFDTPQKRFAQIYNLVINADYLRQFKNASLNSTQKAELLKFIWSRLDSIRNLDLRLPRKIAAEIKLGGNWNETCEVFIEA